MNACETKDNEQKVYTSCWSCKHRDAQLARREVIHKTFVPGKIQCLSKELV